MTVNKGKQLEKVIFFYSDGTYDVSEFKSNPIKPSPIEPLNFRKDHCSKCGVQLEDLMWYSCQRHDCPCGLGGTVYC